MDRVRITNKADGQMGSKLSQREKTSREGKTAKKRAEVFQELRNFSANFKLPPLGGSKDQASSVNKQKTKPIVETKGYSKDQISSVKTRKTKPIVETKGGPKGQASNVKKQKKKPIVETKGGSKAQVSSVNKQKTKPIVETKGSGINLKHHPILGYYDLWTGDSLEDVRAPRDEDLYFMKGVHELADIEAGKPIKSSDMKRTNPRKRRRRDYSSPGWSASLYEYEPLRTGGSSQIRLISVLEDFSRDCLLRCSMKTGSITDKYTAVSYVWDLDVKDQEVKGQQGKGQKGKKECEIVVNGKICRIQENLWKFLRVVRRKFTDSCFWIDAISINQKDVEERSDQVQKMGDIFGNAERVVEWLGDNTDMLKFLRLTKDHYSVHDNTSNNQLISQERMAGELPLYQEFKKLKNWRRAWITQELLLAKRLEFLAGPHEDESNPSVQTSYSVLDAFFTHKEIKDLRPFSGLRRQLNRNRDGSKKKSLKKTPLINLLRTFQGKECRVERDKIYSLLALSNEGPKIHVNYDTSELTFIQHILEVCSHSTCLCSAKLVAAILHAWTSELETPQSYARPPLCTAYMQQLCLPLFSVNMRQWYLLDVGRKTDSSRSNGNTPRLQRNMARCSNCNESLQLPKDTICSRALCFQEVCNINTCHLLWDALGPSKVQFFLSLRDDKTLKHHISKVACDISLEEKCEDGTVIVGFTLQALLSQSWFSLKDQEAVRTHAKISEKHQLCKAARDRKTSFKLCSGETEPQIPLAE